MQASGNACVQMSQHYKVTVQQCRLLLGLLPLKTTHLLMTALVYQAVLVAAPQQPVLQTLYLTCCCCRRWCLDQPAARARHGRRKLWLMKSNSKWGHQLPV